MNNDTINLDVLVQQAQAIARKNGSDAVLFLRSSSAPIPRALNVKLIGSDDEYGWAVLLGNQYICHVYRHGEHAYEMRSRPGQAKAYTDLDDIVNDLGSWFGTEVSVGGL